MRKRKTKKPRKKTPAQIRRIKLKEWSQQVRERDGNKCQVCGSQVHLNAHHILPKEYYKDSMFDVDVGITLCVRCHKWGQNAAHKNGIWFSEWLRTNKPEVWENILRKM